MNVCARWPIARSRRTSWLPEKRLARLPAVVEAGGFVTARSSAPAVSARRVSMSHMTSPPASWDSAKPSTTSLAW